MIVLLLDSPGPERDRVARVLGALGHTVVVPRSMAEMQNALNATPGPEVCIANFSNRQIAALARQVVEARRKPPIWLVATLFELIGSHVREAYDAGADDVMARGASSEEIVGRTEALRRFRARFAADPGAPAEPRFDLNEIDAWRNLDDIVCTELTEMLGAPLVASALTGPVGLRWAAEIPLTVTEHALEVTLGVGVEAGSQDAFCDHVLGGPAGDDVVADAVRELANTGGGAFKRCALASGTAFAMGLPRDVPATAVGAATRRWRLCAEGLSIVVWATYAANEPTRLSARDLKQGMVIAQEIRNGAGMLLIAAGTVLTDRTVVRLLELVGPSAVIEVSRAA